MLLGKLIEDFLARLSE